MQGQSESREHRRLMRRPLLLTTVALWLLFTVLVAAGIQSVAASSRQPSNPNIGQVSATASVPVATDTPAVATATATDTPVPVDTPTDVPTATDTPTDTPVPSNGGGGSNGNPGGSGSGGGGGGSSTAAPDVTRVVFSQPTVAAGNDGAVPALAGATFGSNGLLLATTMSCVVGLLGLTVAGIALVVLMRRGYGPFLRALLRGKRAETTRSKRGKDGVYDADDGQVPSRSASSWRGGTGAASGAGRSMANGRPGSGSYGRAGQSTGQRRPATTRSRTDWR